MSGRARGCAGTCAACCMRMRVCSACACGVNACSHNAKRVRAQGARHRLLQGRPCGGVDAALGLQPLLERGLVVRDAVHETDRVEHEHPRERTEPLGRHLGSGSGLG